MPYQMRQLMFSRPHDLAMGDRNKKSTSIEHVCMPRIHFPMAIFLKNAIYSINAIEVVVFV